MVTGHIIWNPDPVAFYLGEMPVRYYSLLLTGGFLLGYFFARFVYKRENVDRYVLESFGIWLIIGIIVGGRLGHCLVYEFDYYIQRPLEIFLPWEGTMGKDAKFTGFKGFSSHGWIAGLFLAIYINSRIQKISWLWVVDRFALLGLLPGALVRIGNLMNSEMVGTPTQLPWAFIFTKIDDIPRHPAQLYESLFYLLFFLGLFIYYLRKTNSLPNGTYLGIVLTVVFVFRFFIEFIKMDQVPSEASMSLNFGQWLSLPFIVVGLLLIFRARIFPSTISRPPKSN